MTSRFEKAQSALAHSQRLFSEAEVRQTYERLAGEMSLWMRHKNPVILCVMIGGMVPTAELIGRLDFPFELDYLHATRYRGKTSGADLVWKVEPSIELAGRYVLVVDDILDEGHTLAAILRYLRGRGAVDVRSAVLVEKRHDRRDPELKADFTGVEAEDRYLFGCGMDYLGYLRQMPGIYAVPDKFLES